MKSGSALPGCDTKGRRCADRFGEFLGAGEIVGNMGNAQDGMRASMKALELTHDPAFPFRSCSLCS